MYFSTTNLDFCCICALSLNCCAVLSLVDTAYTGRLGSVSIAALGPCTSIFHLCFNTFRALTQSTTA
jgi:Na+-driven multidrug efflux pump